MRLDFEAFRTKQVALSRLRRPRLEDRFMGATSVAKDNVLVFFGVPIILLEPRGFCRYNG